MAMPSVMWDLSPQTSDQTHVPTVEAQSLNHWTAREVCRKRILKAAREKQRVIYKGTPIRLSADYSAETLQARGSGMIYSKCLKKKTSNQDYSTWKSYHSEV